MRLVNGSLIPDRTHPIGPLVSCGFAADEVYAWEFNLNSGGGLAGWTTALFGGGGGREEVRRQQARERASAACPDGYTRVDPERVEDQTFIALGHSAVHNLLAFCYEVTVGGTMYQSDSHLGSEPSDALCAVQGEARASPMSAE